MKTTIPPVLAATALAIALILPAAAEPTSTYSTIAPDKCRQLTADEESGSVTFSCPGINGIDVWVGEGDLRTFLAYGPAPKKQCVSQQTFATFNNAGPTLEWRLDNGEPFATIIRYKMDNGQDEKFNFLTVTALRGGQACHIAYVDGSLTKHNEIARDIADTTARTFDCTKDTPQLISKRHTELNWIVSGAPCSEDAIMKFQ
ncbi:MAG: hypothetical protein ACR2OM_01480 [Aestuariivirgaceae bacterium]